MARKPKKKKINHILLLAAAVMSVLAICTLFMPMLTATGPLTGNNVTISGIEVLDVLFSSDSNGLSFAQMYLRSLKTNNDSAFSTVVFCVAYLVALVAALGVCAYSVLKIMGKRYKLLALASGVAVVLLALVAFIFSFVVAAGMSSSALKWTAGIGSYLAFAAVGCGVAVVCDAKW